MLQRSHGVAAPATVSFATFARDVLSLASVTVLFLALAQGLGCGSSPERKTGGESGQACSSSAECATNYCNAGICCTGGSCCNAPADCPAMFRQAAACADSTPATTCQGTRRDATCTANVCGTVEVPDDSACTGLSHGCGSYKAIPCSSAIDQGEPACPTSCDSPTDCVAGGTCSGGACVATFSIGGTLSGLLPSDTVVLQNNGGDNIAATNGPFTFPMNIANGATYAVTVLTAPAGRTCGVTNDRGTVSEADVIDVTVVCTALCTSGVCCNTANGSFYPTTSPCGTSTEYRCDAPVCGTNAQHRDTTTYCSGISTGCDGQVVPGPWTLVSGCQSDQICTTDSTTYARCDTCLNGCFSGACWPECDPSGPCCSIVGTKTDCWYDATTNLEWENPAKPDQHTNLTSARNYCQGRGTGWDVPTITQLRSLVRGCPSMETGGSCGVTDACNRSTCDDTAPCTDCAVGGGPGINGNYWPPALGGPSDSFYVRYWSRTAIDDRISVITGQHGYWFIGYRSAYLWWDWETTVNFLENEYVVRCVKSR